MRQRVWHSSQSYDVKDVAGNDWFKLEGKDAQVMNGVACGIFFGTVCYDMEFVCVQNVGKSRRDVSGSDIFVLTVDGEKEACLEYWSATL